MLSCDVLIFYVIAPTSQMKPKAQDVCKCDAILVKN